MAITKESLKSAIDQMDERDLPMLYRMIGELQELNQPKSGKRMAAILQRMADRNALADIDDPVKWQREIREDRPLPGRE